MSSADDIQEMLDDVYGVSGISCQWTPAGGSAHPFTGLIGGGDQAAQFHGTTVQMNMAAISLKLRVSEALAVSPGRVPQAGDAIAFLDDTGAVTQSLIIAGDPRREDPRRLEWTLHLALG